MASPRPNGADSPSPPPPPASPRPPKIEPRTRPRPRPKLVSFGRDSLLGGRPDTDGPTHVQFIHEHSPDIIPTRMSSEVDPLLKEVLSPIGSDDDWMGEQQTEETKSSWFLFLLTFGGLGLSIGWSVETSNGSVSTPIVHLCVTPVLQ